LLLIQQRVSGSTAGAGAKISAADSQKNSKLLLHYTLGVCGFMQINTILGQRGVRFTCKHSQRPESRVEKVPLAAPISSIWAWPDLLSLECLHFRWPDEISRMQKTETWRSVFLRPAAVSPLPHCSPQHQARERREFWFTQTRPKLTTHHSKGLCKLSVSTQTSHRNFIRIYFMK
jgi:hypothetical protein